MLQFKKANEGLLKVKRPNVVFSETEFLGIYFNYAFKIEDM